MDIVRAYSSVRYPVEWVFLDNAALVARIVAGVRDGFLGRLRRSHFVYDRRVTVAL